MAHAFEQDPFHEGGQELTSVEAAQYAAGLYDFVFEEFQQKTGPEIEGVLLLMKEAVGSRLVGLTKDEINEALSLSRHLTTEELSYHVPVAGLEAMQQNLNDRARRVQEGRLPLGEEE
jgi:hypothetical protein